MFIRKSAISKTTTTTIKAAILLLASQSSLPALGAEEGDSVGKPLNLHEVTVTTAGPRKILRTGNSDGAIIIDGKMMGEQGTSFSSPDPLALIRTLPAVATTNDLQATVCVRGNGPGDNLFLADGIPVANPMHLLGLFSAYNPTYYSKYTFRAGRLAATSMSGAAGVFEARRNEMPNTAFSGAISAGIIESHFGLHIPLKPGRASISLGARKTYLDLLFPNLLTLGSSTLNYGFSDVNIGLTLLTGRRGILQVSTFADKDIMNACNKKNGAKDGRFGWTNLCSGVKWTNRLITASLSYTRYANLFELKEGGTTLDIPTTLTRITAMATFNVNSHWEVESDLNYRHCDGQYNHYLMASGRNNSHSWEWNTGSTYRIRHRAMQLETGLRLTYYSCSGYNVITPQPRLNLSFEISKNLIPYISYTRTAGYERLIQESTGGLPADFTTLADTRIRPLDVHNFETGISGTIPGIYVSYLIDGYYKIMQNVGEYTGALIDFNNSSYDPKADFHTGHGYAAGLSATVMRQFGKIRGRVSYNLGVSRAKIKAISADYFPTSYDRLHDLTATVSWQPHRRLTLSATYTHATGLPYTRAKFGYMIGENLICEYFPHNSSRLPAYNRLDLSAAYTINCKHVSHLIRASIYNATASHNVLFIYTSYSISDGISQRQSIMKTVIPSISYTLQF